MLASRPAPAIAAALLALAVAGCGSKRVPNGPFKVPAEKLGPALRVVALAPVNAPADIGDADAAKGRFLASIVARLRSVGVAVIPPAEVGPVLAAAEAGRGGFVDPLTGRFDEGKAKAAHAWALKTLAGRFGRVDAILVPELRVVRAAVAEDTARWDGTSESASTGMWKGEPLTQSGSVRALSLLVRLTGPAGDPVYANAGGLRVLDRIGVRGTTVPVPLGDLFVDEERNAKAVSLAMDPLVEVVRAATAPPPGATSGTAPTGPPPAAGPRR